MTCDCRDFSEDIFFGFKSSNKMCIENSFFFLYYLKIKNGQILNKSKKKNYLQTYRIL